MPNYTAVISSATVKPRPGVARAAATPTPAVVTDGLELSEIVYKPASWFRPNPANEVFRALKTDAYLADLEADIRANGVTENLVAMADGLILSGESRAICGARIGPDYKLPVRLVLSPLSEEEQEKRLILSNILRFEIPEDVRLVLAKRAGLFSDVTREEAAAAMGKSLRQVKRDAAVLREAEERAQAEGRAEPTPGDVAAARDKRNANRRAPSTPKRRVDIIKLESTLAELDGMGGEYKAAATIVRGAIGW